VQAIPVSLKRGFELGKGQGDLNGMMERRKRKEEGGGGRDAGASCAGTVVED
jgi:hypothetical protein